MLPRLQYSKIARSTFSTTMIRVILKIKLLLLLFSFSFLIWGFKIMTYSSERIRPPPPSLEPFLWISLPPLAQAPSKKARLQAPRSWKPIFEVFPAPVLAPSKKSRLWLPAPMSRFIKYFYRLPLNRHGSRLRLSNTDHIQYIHS